MATTTTVRRTVLTTHDSSSSSSDAALLTKRRESYTVRYASGWRNPEQDRKPTPRVSRVISQDYNAVKQDCLAKNVLWEDPAFPATDKSIYPSSQGPLPFKWMRPLV